jgi:hypothetical protein
MPRTGRGEKRVGGEGVQGRLSHLHSAHAHITTYFVFNNTRQVHVTHMADAWLDHDDQKKLDD